MNSSITLQLTMTTSCLKPTKMKSIILICQLFLILRIEAQQLPSQCITSDTNRAPRNSDITVTCGTEFMDLSIFLCPIYNANYNESLMILNGQTINACKGTADFTVTPPVLKFRFSINEQSLSACNNQFRTIDMSGTGQFSQFSNVQYVNISGLVVSWDPASGMITYRPQITYMFSCQYPLQYVLNNTQLAVAGVNLAINDNNGSFISTLKINLYNNQYYNSTLLIPQTGLDLKTKIYVEVSATNLSSRFNVLLDQCFATTQVYDNTPIKGYDLFVGCDHDTQTKVEQNGVSQKAHFVFEAFRFVEHKNLTVSKFYLHCITRLCNVSMCPSMLPDCTATAGRRRRAAEDPGNSATVTSPPIYVGQTPNSVPESSANKATDGMTGVYSGPVVAVIVCVAILSVLLAAMGAYFTWNVRHKLPL